MKLTFLLCLTWPVALLFAATLRVDVNAMPKVVFTGDSQTCGRVGALDYPQMLSWDLPIRVINTGVGGTGIRHLLGETTGGAAAVARGEKVIHGTKVPWHAGPHPGQKVRLGPQEYVIDRIETVSYRERRANLWITEPAREDFEGRDYTIEPGWRARVAQHRPDYACFMYSVNDTDYSSEVFQRRLQEMLRRTEELGAQAIFLTGFPLMDAAKGGSHPGGNHRVTVRAQDMAAFCRDRQQLFGDVFRTLMTLDEQATSVWADTVHPTTDGSTAALSALRAIFRGLGVAQNPHYLRAYRAPNGLGPPAEGLKPITTSQPDYDASNRQNENGFDLAAIRVRDEYGLIADADGDALKSAAPIVLQFGVGDPSCVTAARAEIFVGALAEVSVFDWTRAAWQPLGKGVGRVSVELPNATLANAVHDRALWLAVSSEPEVKLDYACLDLAGSVGKFRARAKPHPTAWPPAGTLMWTGQAGSLIANGDFTAAEGDTPQAWRAEGDQALYHRCGPTVQGTGAFTGERRVDQLKAPGCRFTQTVRPQDAVVVTEGPDSARGRFLVWSVMDDETLRLRRRLPAAVEAAPFRVERSSGCAAAPGGCMVECRGSSGWSADVAGLAKGRYRLGLYYRAFDPQRMNSKHRPGPAAAVTVADARTGAALLEERGLAMSFQWQCARLDFDVPATTQATVHLAATSDCAVQYTGVTLHPLPKAQ